MTSGPGKGAEATWKLIRILQQRDGDNCMHCGEPIDFLLPFGFGKGASIDHVRPRAAGGGDELANLQIMHFKPCQLAKGAWWEGVDYGRVKQREAREQQMRNYARAVDAELKRQERAARNKTRRRRDRPDWGYVPGRD